MSSPFLNSKLQLPQLGVGLGLRGAIRKEIFVHSEQIDWLEFTPENFMTLRAQLPQQLEQAAQKFPLISHGVNLSIGSADPLNMEYLRQLKQLIDEVNVPWWSDHLCFASVDDVYFNDLMPLQWSRQTAQHVIERIKRAQDFIGRPFLIENITYYALLKNTDLREAEFISTIIEEADCGLLLDINNVYVNSVNHQFDPLAFLESIPLERVVQIHMAGHTRVKDRLIDTHGSNVIEPVFELLQFVLERANVNSVMIERDQYFGCFSEVLRDLKRIREMWLLRQQNPADSSRRESASAICRQDFANRESAPNTGTAADADIAQPQRLFFNAWMSNDSTQQKLADPEQISVYVWLLLNNHESLFKSQFPLTAKVIGSEWRDLVAACIASNPPKNYSVVGMGEDFKQFITQYDGCLLEKVPFLKDIVRYEYLQFWHSNVSPTVLCKLTELPKTLEELGHLKPIVHPTLDLQTFEIPIATIASQIKADRPIQFEPQVQTVAFLRTSENQECTPIAVSPLAADNVKDAIATGDSYVELLRRHYHRIPDAEPAEQMLQALTILSKCHELGLFIDTVELGITQRR